MIDFERAVQIVLETVDAGPVPVAERISLDRSVGRVLLEEVLTSVAVPSRDYSAMDGYAVNTRDFSAQGATTLTVSGECQTGHPMATFGPGACVRIFTGAAIPPEANAVVMQENVSLSGDSVVFKESPTIGAHIRRAGEDLQVGDKVLGSGTRLNAYHLSLLASVERTEVIVARRPRVSILCTGDELRPPGSTSEPGTLAESNSAALTALIEQAGGSAIRAPLVKDNLQAMKEALTLAGTGSDIIVTVGGVSVGDHDVVRPALEAMGAEMCFQKVKMKPGKPVLLAQLDDALVLGLPGNPSSALVTFSLFGIPLIKALCGDTDPLPLPRKARLLKAFKQKPGRKAFYRGRLSAEGVEIYANQSSGANTAMAWANALVVFDEETESVEEGAEVSVISYSDL